MSDPTLRPPIAISTPSGLVELAVRVVAVTTGTITAEFDMPTSVHDTALAAGWFHLGPLSAGVGARSFGPGADVRVEARLDPRLVAGLLQVIDTPAGMTEMLEKFDATSALRSEASWYACAATREVLLDEDDPELATAFEDGSLREGYRTAWGSAPSPGGLPIVAYLAELLERQFSGVDPLVEQSGFQWRVTGNDVSWTSTAIVDGEHSWCALYSVLDDTSNGVARDVLVERANDLNTGLLFGSWSAVGEAPSIRFRSNVEIPEGVAAGALLDRLVSRHLDIVDEYASVLLG